MKHYQLTQHFRTNTSVTLVLIHDLLRYPWHKKTHFDVETVLITRLTWKWYWLNLQMSNEEQFYTNHRKDAAAAHVVSIIVSFCAWLVIWWGFKSSWLLCWVAGFFIPNTLSNCQVSITLLLSTATWKTRNLDSHKLLPASIECFVALWLTTPFFWIWHHITR